MNERLKRSLSYLMGASLSGILIAAIAPCMIGMAAQGAAAEPAMQTIRPVPSTNILINPGRGWMMWGSPTNFTPSQLAIGSMAYQRWDWSEIEPTEGVYRWEIIDRAIATWAALGKRFAFGVACANPHGPEYVTPKWVFDAGAKSVIVMIDPRNYYEGAAGTRVVPVYNDPVFMAKLNEFIQAMGKRYDGNPNLDFVDMRSYGNWGEGNPNGRPPISTEEYRQHVQIHMDAFRKTQLVLPYGYAPFTNIYEWATSQGVGRRRDGIGGSSVGDELLSCFGKAPAVFEFHGSYTWMQKTFAFNKERLLVSMNMGRPSYVVMDLELMAAEPELFRKLSDRIGYHLLIEKAELPRRLSDREPLAVTIDWRNDGLAYIHVPCRVALALLDREGRPVARSWADGSAPKSWAPGRKVTELLTAPLVPPALDVGPWFLAVGLCTETNSGPVPSVALGIEGGKANRWYALATVFR